MLFDSCTVTSNTSHGIQLQVSNESSSEVRNCLVADNGGLGVEGGWCNPIVRSSRVLRNGQHGVGSAAFARIFDSEIEGNQGNGLWAGFSAVASGSSFKSNNGDWGIAVNQNGVGTIYMTNCSVALNRGGGILAPQPNNVFHGVEFLDNGGIGARASGVFRDCRIEGNAQQGILAEQGIAAMTGCVVRGNKVGIEDNHASESEPSIGITDNDIHDNLQFEIRNIGPGAIVAANNYWGQPTTAELDAGTRNLSRIWDSQDASTVGQVVLRPYRKASIVNPCAAPEIQGNPRSVTAALGRSVVFEVTASGVAPLGYLWIRNGTPLANGPRIQGVDTPRLTISDLQLQDGGEYYVRVSGCGTSVQSDVATLRIPAVFVTNPASVVTRLGEGAVFQAEAVGWPTPSLQWYFGSQPIPGATSGRLVISVTGPESVGDYSVRATQGSDTSVSSQRAGLWLNDLKQYAGVLLYGPVGGSATVRVADQVGTSPISWSAWTNVVIRTVPEVVIDYDSPNHPFRVYQTLPQ